ncbi:MAG: N-acetylneuraminate synthase family protein [Deltaproteobacteria bacterium]|nr:N-acetylneuraminate synthase family protein [Deltaproteobacteria bacterium]
MAQLTIDHKLIHDDGDCYVIAEIGHNHQGSLQMAKELFRAAKECGADAVKLQKRNNPGLYTEELYNKPYDHENSFGATYGEHREALEFGLEEYEELIQYAKDIGITFFATAFDFQSADFLADLNMPAFKIASGDLTNTPLLKYVAKFHKPMLISTGGGTMKDVIRAYDTIMPINPQLCIMQCTAGYPPAYEEMNLRVIQTFRARFPDIIIGLSSHDSGIAMPLIGYILGARIIEKHFTLNRAMKGTDHAFSLERPGLSKVIRDLRRARVALGDGVKQPYPSEKAPLFKMAKKLVASTDIPAGHVLTRDDIAIKSPNDGMPPYEIEKIIGEKMPYAMKKDEAFSYLNQ